MQLLPFLLWNNLLFFCSLLVDFTVFHKFAARSDGINVVNGMKNQPTLEEQHNPILEKYAKKIQQQERRCERVQIRLAAIEEAEERLQQAFPSASEYVLMGLGCSAALIFDFFVSRTTVSWLATLIGIPAAFLALAYTLLDAGFAALASGRTGKNPLEKRLFQKRWQKVLWSLAAIKIALFAAFIFFVRQQTSASLISQLFELLFQTAMVGIIYYVLHHAGAGILYVIWKGILAIRKLAIGTPQRCKAKIQKLCFKFLEEVQQMKLDLEKLCQQEEYQGPCKSCITSIIEVQEPSSFPSGKPPSSSYSQETPHGQPHRAQTIRKVPKDLLTISSPPIQKLVGKILRSHRNLQDAIAAHSKIEQVESKIQELFHPPAHYVLLSIVALVTLSIDFFLSRATLGWLSSLTHIPGNLLAFLIMLLDGVIAALASGKTQVLVQESRRSRTVWSTALWGLAVIKIALFLSHVLVYKSYAQMFNLAPIVEILILIGLILIIYVALFWAGEGLVWLATLFHLLIWKLVVPPPSVYREKLHRLCDQLRSLLKALQIKPNTICAVYQLDCSFCKTKPNQKQ